MTIWHRLAWLGAAAVMIAWIGFWVWMIYRVGAWL